MPSLADFPITRRWPAQHPDRLQLYSLNTPNGVKVSIMLEESGLPFNTTSNQIAYTSNYGAQYQHWNGVDLTTTARFAGNTTAQGGITFGKTMTDNCAVIAAAPQLVASNPVEYCHAESGWQPQLKFLANYELPWWGVRVSGNFQSLTGPAIQAGVIFTGAQALGAEWCSPCIYVKLRPGVYIFCQNEEACNGNQMIELLNTKASHDCGFTYNGGARGVSRQAGRWWRSL